MEMQLCFSMAEDLGNSTQEENHPAWGSEYTTLTEARSTYKQSGRHTGMEVHPPVLCSSCSPVLLQLTS